MGLTRINEDKKVICKFEGEMDTVACKEVEEELTAILEECSSDNPMPVEFDIAGVNYVASSFLRLCGKAANMLGRDNLSIVNVTPQVKKVFKIAGLADNLNIS